MLSSPLWLAAFFVYGLVYDCVYEQKVWGIWVRGEDEVGVIHHFAPLFIKMLIIHVNHIK